MARRLPLVNTIIDAAQLLDELEPSPVAITPDVPEWFDLKGTWVHVNQCNRPRDVVFVRSNNCANFGCGLTGQAFGSGYQTWATAVLNGFFSGLGTTTATHLTVWDQKVVGSGFRYDLADFFVCSPCPDGAAKPRPKFHAEEPGYRVPLPEEARLPEVDAHGQSKPAPLVSDHLPAPLPYRLVPLVQVNELRAPSERSEWGGGGESPPPRVRRPRTPWKRPPGRRTKERKFTLAGFSQGPLRRLLEQALEAAEVAQCLGKAAGAPKGPAASMLAYAYRNADKIDGCKLVECLINDYIEDQFFGQIGKASGAAHGGGPVGALGYKRPALKEFDLQAPSIKLGC